ncbi:penicillinase repressor [Erysipelothrix piscisicarius]|uniref:Penicillinase repressor n=1 Tax=Erysipelothrix piscisicarius TaxID=2485784 RepID=A0A3Q8S2X0_9FIRM|nr:penicillinase repressor [Erysipelothrix piscisicarius]AZK44371.1 penicillinase repressor [Erysipelothrix piscisicarius]
MISQLEQFRLDKLAEAIEIQSVLSPKQAKVLALELYQEIDWDDVHVRSKSFQRLLTPLLHERNVMRSQHERTCSIKRGFKFKR